MPPTIRRARPLRSLLLSALALGLGLFFGAPARGAPDEVAFVPGRLLVRFEQGTPPGLADALLETHGARTIETIEGIDVLVVALPEQADERAVAHAFRNAAFVEFAELDEIQGAESLTPNDRSLSKQWHVTKIEAPSAWGATTGSPDVIVAILDSGVDGSHPDLAPKLVPGWNVYDGNADTSDVHGHGTAVAGAAAAATDNGIGIAGIAWSCPIMPIRIADASCYATYSSAAKGLTWASDHGARVANLSFRFSTSSTVTTAAKYFQDRGGVVAMAAGNQGDFDASADNPYVLTVSATTSSDTLASFSNTGNLIDVAAPGTGIYTTSKGGGYTSWQGTSFASPIVAGVAALVISANPALTGAQAAGVVMDGADDLGTAGWDASFGWGRVNAARAIALATGTEPAPTPSDPAPEPTVDTTSPSISIVSPADQSAVSGNVSVKVTTSDDRGVVKVELLVDGRVTATSTAAPFTTKWNTRKAATGSHVLETRAYDAAGNLGTSAGVTVRK